MKTGTYKKWRKVKKPENVREGSAGKSWEFSAGITCLPGRL